MVFQALCSKGVVQCGPNLSSSFEESEETFICSFRGGFFEESVFILLERLSH